MKKIIAIISGILILAIVCIAISSLFINDKEQNNVTQNNYDNVSEKTNVINDARSEISMIKLSVNDKILSIKLENNSSSIAFIEKLKDGEIIINANDYGNFEKVGELGFSLPTNDKEITTEVGDLILYQGNKITLYYDTNTWNFTKLGKVQNVTQEELKQILGDGDVTLKFSILNEESKAPTIKLNSGYEMPMLGIGTYSLHDETCVNSIYTAIECGYRKIDTAYMYGNEEEVGEAVRKAINDGLIKREDIFVATKLYPNQFDNPEESIEQALEKLDIGYIDLMLLHHPGTNDVKAYKAMEKYVEQGKIKSIGLSNYYIEEIDEFLPKVTITPALVQNEIHPYYQEREVVRHIQELGIVVEGWYPLGGRGHQKELLSDEILVKIAESHNKSVAQVILRWDYQNKVVVVPGSSNPDHILENISIFDFELTDEEMKEIDSLNRDEKHDWY